MSSLTEAEKRKLLRERRAQKVKDGSSRLGRITGDRSGLEQNISAPTIPTTPTTASTISTTPTVSTKSKRISQTFDSSDPDIEDISRFDPAVSSSGSSQEQEQFEKMMQSILSAPEHQHNNDNSKEFDLFSQLLSGVPNSSGTPPGADGSSDGTPAFELQRELIAYHKQQNDKFKAKFILIRLIASLGLCLYFFLFTDYHSSSFPIARISEDNLSFFKVFAAIEIIATSYYGYILNQTRDEYYNYNSKILSLLGFVPDTLVSQQLKAKVRLLVKYLELTSMGIYDVSVIIIFFGLVSYMH